ncbi:hypothetical protein AMECASPLE_026304 [Ameca splendens]|uniref:Uncharacterized protein n=1 Tax=Ameca splendens TaxID=208324 RepID=A0ABV1A2V7_9TELE
MFRHRLSQSRSEEMVLDQVEPVDSEETWMHRESCGHRKRKSICLHENQSQDYNRDFMRLGLITSPGCVLGQVSG